MKILIVDDENDALVYLETLLSNQGYHVSLAQDGKQALILAQWEQPDLIISDGLMPNMDGFELCQKIKQDAELNHIPFILYTATYVAEQDKTLALASGAARFLLKPMEPEALISEINNVLHETHNTAATRPNNLQIKYHILEKHRDALANKLSKKLTELKAQKKCVDLLLDSTAEGIIAVNRQGICTMSNPASAHILGYSDLLQHHLGNKIYAHLNTQNTPIDITLQQGKAQHFEDHQLSKANGELLEVELFCRPMLQDEEIVGAVISFLDISQRKQALADKAAADAANRAKSAFLASMSHELRTPLNAILGFSEILRRDPSVAEPHHKTLDIIHKSGDHLLTLINDVLAIAKIEAGHVQLEEKPLNLHNLIHDVIDMLKVRAREKDLFLSLDQHSNIPCYIVGDQNKLQQILINLLSNAIKATDFGNITLNVNHNATQLLIDVIDSGCGIAPQDQTKIFETFVQLDNQQGAGLGLAITQQFIKMMGGKISLHSTLGVGSTFHIELPIKLAQAEEIQNQISSSGEVSKLAPEQINWRVLVVEDDQANQLLLKQLLSSVGFKVKTANNGLEAIGQFRDWQPHFIWMDYHMPIMNGKISAQRIRTMPGGTDVRIAAVTTLIFEENTKHLDTPEFDAIIHKPFRAQEIFDCMEKLLNVKFIRTEPTHRNTPTLSPNDLAALPEAIRTQLKEALLSLDAEAINLAIEQITTHNPKLAEALRGRVAEYDYEGILGVM